MKTSKKTIVNPQTDKEIYVYAHTHYSYKDAVEFIRLSKRQAE